MYFTSFVGWKCKKKTQLSPFHNGTTQDLSRTEETITSCWKSEYISYLFFKLQTESCKLYKISH